jgi:cell wall assembly regulator SMI1
MNRKWVRVTTTDQDPNRTLAALKQTFPRMRLGDLVHTAGRLRAGLPVVVKQREVQDTGALTLTLEDGPMLPLQAEPHAAFEHAWFGLKALLYPIVPFAYDCLEGPALKEDVALLEADLGRALPAELKSLLSLHDGQRAAGPLLWELAPICERMMTWQWLRRSGHPVEWWNPDWFPVLSNGSGDYLVLDLSKPEPPLIEYRHDAEERRVIAPSLSSWIEELHEDLCVGRLFASTLDGRFSGLTPTVPSEPRIQVIRFDYS